jgi:hypothetical protein
MHVSQYTYACKYVYVYIHACMQEARRLLTRALRIDPNNDEVALNLASILHQRCVCMCVRVYIYIHLHRHKIALNCVQFH